MADTLLTSGVSFLGLKPDPGHIGKIQLLHRGLLRWNRVYNLTKVEDEAEFITKHVLDSLSIHPYLSGQRILDVGTGAGFPGFPLAIFFPEMRFVLLDAVGKKIRFVRQMALELGLSNVSAVHQRIEHYAVTPRFDTIITRAFADVGSSFFRSRHLLEPGGRFLAMKGRYPSQELDAIDELPHRVSPLTVPGLKAERHLIEITEPEGT